MQVVYLRSRNEKKKEIRVIYIDIIKEQKSTLFTNGRGYAPISKTVGTSGKEENSNFMKLLFHK